jgi:hypothetical protein
MADINFIADEGDLWALLQAMLEDGSRQQIDLRMLHIAWRPKLLYFPDAPISHIVSPSIAKSIAGFHRNLAKGFALAAYGRADARFLRAEDHKALDLNFLATGGSSGIELDGSSLKDLLIALSQKMSGRQITTAIILVALFYFSATVADQWIKENCQTQRHIADSSERVNLSVEETKRMQLLADALTQRPDLKGVQPLADESKKSLARSVTTVNHAQLLGADIDQQQARAILAPSLDKKEGRQITGKYEVEAIDIDNPEGWKGKLRDPRNGGEFTATINRTELTQADIDVLFGALEDKTQIEARLNAWFSGDEENPTRASITEARPKSE